jgi:uncharacterized protein YyaL (SSP411 family)
VQVLGQEDGRRFCEAYGIGDPGNFEEGASVATLRAASFEERLTLHPLRERLLHARQERVPPQRDTKQLVSWNALAIHSLALAGFQMSRKDWLLAARHAADWIWEKTRHDGNRLHSVAYDDDMRHNGTLDDYAFLARAMLSLASKVDWIEPGAHAAYIDRARALTEAVFAHFGDADAVGYFQTSNDHETLPARKKDWFDTALPCGNSAMVHVLSQLHALTGEHRYAEALDTFSWCLHGLLARHPAPRPTHSTPSRATLWGFQ